MRATEDQQRDGLVIGEAIYEKAAAMMAAHPADRSSEKAVHFGIALAVSQCFLLAARKRKLDMALMAEGLAAGIGVMLGQLSEAEQESILAAVESGLERGAATAREAYEPKGRA